MPLKLMYITNDVNISCIAQSAGVDSVFVDLEKLGKNDRQGHVDSVKSNHRVEDIANLRPYLTRSKLLVRINPINPNTENEINTVIKNGADIVMLPMFENAQEVRKFLNLISGRAKTMLLLETVQAEESIDEILEVPGIDEIYIGLNDLHLAHKMMFMFELLANGTVERLCKKIASKGIPYGFGGVSALGSGVLPAERILAEHYRLGSSRVILSRSFCNTATISDLTIIERIFKDGVSQIREFEKFLIKQPEAYYIENKLEVGKIVNSIVEGHQKDLSE